VYDGAVAWKTPLAARCAPVPVPVRVRWSAA